MTVFVTRNSMLSPCCHDRSGTLWCMVAWAALPSERPSCDSVVYERHYHKYFILFTGILPLSSTLSNFIIHADERCRYSRKCIQLPTHTWSCWSVRSHPWFRIQFARFDCWLALSWWEMNVASSYLSANAVQINRHFDELLCQSTLTFILLVLSSWHQEATLASQTTAKTPTE